MKTPLLQPLINPGKWGHSLSVLSAIVARFGEKSRCYHLHVACRWPNQRNLGEDAFDPDYSGADSFEYAVLDELANRCVRYSTAEEITLRLYAFESIVRVNRFPSAYRAEIADVYRIIAAPKTVDFKHWNRDDYLKRLRSISVRTNKLLLHAPEFRI